MRRNGARTQGCAPRGANLLTWFRFPSPALGRSGSNSTPTSFPAAAGTGSTDALKLTPTGPRVKAVLRCPTPRPARTCSGHLQRPGAIRGVDGVGGGPHPALPAPPMNARIKPGHDGVGGMAMGELARPPNHVMAGLDPAIHAAAREASGREDGSGRVRLSMPGPRVPGTSPGMTRRRRDARALKHRARDASPPVRDDRTRRSAGGAGRCRSRCRWACARWCGCGTAPGRGWRGTRPSGGRTR